MIAAEGAITGVDNYEKAISALTRYDDAIVKVVASKNALTAAKGAEALADVTAIRNQQIIVQAYEEAIIEATKQAGVTSDVAREKINAALAEEVNGTAIKGCTAAKLEDTLASLGVQEAERKEIIARYANADAAKAEGSAISKTFASIKGVIGKAIGWVKANPYILAIAAIGAVIYGVAQYHKKLSEAVQENIDKYNDLKSEAESLESNLKSVRDRMKELSELEAPTEADEEELKKLKETNEHLERQLIIKKALQKQAAIDTEKAAEKELNSKNFGFHEDAFGGPTIGGSTWDDEAKRLVESVKKRREELKTAEADLAAASSNVDSAAYKRTKRNYDQIQKNLDDTLAQLTTLYNDTILRLEEAIGEEADTPFGEEQLPKIKEAIAEISEAFQEIYEIPAEAEDGETLASKLLPDPQEIASLKDVLESFNSISSIISDAQNDMASTGSVSAETIAKLSEITENYTDYLYEENGQIQLNIEALRQLADAKRQSNIHALDTETSFLQEQTRLLEEKLAAYKRYLSASQMDAKAQEELKALIDETTDSIENNNAKIEENQKLLALYSSLLNEWDTTLSAFDTYSSSMESLAKVQDAVSEGYTITAAKARELAAVYPEILNAAEATANGEIQLNADVVNALLEGKQAELQSTIDAEIAKLTAKRSSAEAELEIVNAQIEAARSGDEAAVESANNAAAAKMLIFQAVLTAATEAGIDEKTANQMALAAMTEDWDTFQELAITAVQGLDEESADAFTSVMGNFATMARNIVGNNNQLIGSFSRLGEAVRNAMAGKVTAQFAHNIKEASVSAASKDGVRKTLSEMFEASKSDYGDGGVSIKDKTAEWTKQLQDAFNSYSTDSKNIDNLLARQKELQQKIASYNSQITLLEGMKNTPLEKFSSSSGSSKGSSGSDQKEIEEYIAEVDKYREALERLRKAKEASAEIERKIDNSSNLKEQILLQRELTGTYANQQVELQKLDQQRDATIASGVQSLRELGFAVKYNAETNELWIENLEHINDLTADSKGEYDSLQEATNALRKDTEDLIGTITDLNEANQEGAQDWLDLADSIQEADQKINDLLDEIVQKASEAVDDIQGIYDTLHDAADEYAESGWITVDTLQSIIDLGVEYMAYLYDENGQLVINEERIQAVIAARTRQLAVESALAYVEALRIAKNKDDVTELNRLLYATEAATDATWGLVYANLAYIGLGSKEHQAALNNINAIRALSESAVESIGKTADASNEELERLNAEIERTESEIERLKSELKSLEEIEDGVNDILKYTMDMLKDRTQEQIDLLNEMKNAYSEIVNQKKESLRASREEANYQKTIADKAKEIAKIQAKIDLLSLDDSREAQAERAKLAEELAKLQKDLADDQADHAYDTTSDALDKMEDAYHKEKDKEIEILEKSISSQQKLYDMAIEYIKTHWETLISELIEWNTACGSSLNKEISAAWEDCLAAAQRYGSYLEALNKIELDKSNIQDRIDEYEKIRDELKNEANKIESSNGNNSGNNPGGAPNTIVGKPVTDSSYSQEEGVIGIVNQMRFNAEEWKKAKAAKDENKKKIYDAKNLELGALLKSKYGLNVHSESTTGVWYVGTEKLFDKYHSGGVVGGVGTKNNNELMTILKKGEIVLNDGQQGKLLSLFHNMKDTIQQSMAAVFGSALNRTVSIPSSLQPGMTSYSPNIEVNINHNGSISDDDAKRYGQTIADTAPDKL